MFDGTLLEFIQSRMQNLQNIRPQLAKQEFQKSTEIQSLLFDNKMFNVKQAKKWAKDNDFKFGKVDETKSKIRLRQFSPKNCQKDTFRTIELTKGISGIICVPK